MATELATGYVALIPSAKGFRGAIESEIGPDLERAGGDAGDRTAKTFGTRFSGGIKTAAKAAAVGFGAAFAGAIVLGKQGIDAASNLEEAQTKVNVVFGDGADAVSQWAQSAATGFGQSTRQALEAAGTYGNLFQAFGVGQRPATEMSQTLVELAADLASFNNTSVDDALLALQSGLSGETEPLKRYGVALSDVRLRQKALELGLISSTTDAMDPAIKAQASYALILQDTTIAQGDFARTSDGLANQQRTLSARFENAKAAIGTALLPAMTTVVSFIADSAIPTVQRLAEEWMPRLRGAFEAVSTWVQANWPRIRETVQGVFDNIRATVEGAVSFIQGIWENFGEQIISVAQSKLEMVWAVIKGGLEVVQGIFQTISALIHGDWSGVWDGLQRIVSGAWQGISAIVGDALNTVKQALSAAWEIVVAVTAATWDRVKSAVSSAIDSVVGFFAALPGRAATAAAGLASAIAGKVADMAGTAKSAISGFLSDAVLLFQSLPSRAAMQLGQLGSMLAGKITEAAGAVLGKVRDLIGDAVNLMAGLPGKMVSAIGNLAGSVSSAVFGTFREGVNGAIRRVNDLIPNSVGLLGFSIDLPDNPIPVLHSGGIVPGRPGTDVPTILQAGELVVSRAQLASGQYGGGNGITLQHFGQTVTPATVDRALRLSRAS